METATNIETDLWNKLIKYHIDNGWNLTYKYDNFDAGIDFDFIIIENKGEEILFGWDNWFEGELQCSKQRMKQIEELFNQKFKKGDPENLKPDVIDLNRKWKLEDRWNAKNQPTFLAKLLKPLQFLKVNR